MVYESDFYTTRRPYSRPLVSSYSITERPITLPLSTILQLRSIPRMPYVAHKRLVTVIHMPYHTVYHGGSLIPIRVHARVRPSVLAAEINRIRNLTRPSTESYIEKYLQSKDHIYFDDEAREIRARVDSLLRRVHVFVPRAVASDFLEEIVPERMRSGDYVRRLISGKHNAKKDMLEPISWYEVPDRGNIGNLACVKYVAGKPQSVRRPYFKVADLRPSDIKNDVNFLSYYSKNREAAANALKQDKEEAIKRIEQYLVKAAEEAKSDEERKQAAEEEKVRLEMEELKAWEALQAAQERVAHLDEIVEQEKAEAIRQAEEAKIEAERIETERIVEEERKIAEARTTALLKEQERMIIEEHLEKTRQEEEKEERLANVTFADADEVKDLDHSRDDLITCSVTDQEKEERLYDAVTDDDTRIEETIHEEEHFEMTEDPFVEEPTGAESKPEGGANAAEELPKVEEITSGGEESFEWGDEDA